MRKTCSWSWLLALAMIGATGCDGSGGDAGDGPDAGPREPELPEQIDELINEAPPIDLSDPAVVAAAATYSDPDAVAFTALSWALIAGLQGDASCPQLTDESDVDAGIARWRLEGGCTSTVNFAATETTYEGSIVAEGDRSSTTIRYEAFTATWTGECEGEPYEARYTLNGFLQIPTLYLLGRPADPMDEPTPEGAYRIAVLLELHGVDEACNPDIFALAYDVDQSVEIQRPGDDPEVSVEQGIYEMSGRVAVHGELVTDMGELEHLTPPHGQAAMLALRPRDQAAMLALRPQDNGMEMPRGSWRFSAEGYTLELPDVQGAVECAEPLEGTLILEAGDDQATIFADGAEACSAAGQPACAPWSLNGEDQPDELCGFGCAAGPGAPPPWSAMALILAGLLWQRHRRRRGHQQR